MCGLHVAFVGKGGAGKSVVSATVARLLARRGHRVLALDSDTFPGLSLSLGALVPGEPPLNAASERDENGRWRLRKGIGPVRAVQRFATDAPDGVHLLQAGKHGPDGLGPVMGAVNAFNAVVHRLRGADALRDWAIVGDLSAGPRQTAFDWAPYADRLLVVVEPTWQSMLTARRIVRIAGERRDIEPLLIVNKVLDEHDPVRVAGELGAEVIGTIPADEGVRTAERAGVALLDHAPEGPAVEAIQRLVERLDGGTVGR